MAAKTSLNKVVYLTKIDEKIISRNTLRKIELFPLNSESSKLKLLLSRRKYSLYNIVDKLNFF